MFEEEFNETKSDLIEAQNKLRLAVEAYERMLVRRKAEKLKKNGLKPVLSEE